jgi:hypothetical protein
MDRDSFLHDVGDGWEAELKAVADRLATKTSAAEADAAQASATSWRRATPGATFYSPMPFEARARFEPGGRWSDDDDEPADHVVLDELGRPIVTIDAWSGRPTWMWHYDDEHYVVEEVELRRSAVRRQLRPSGDATTIVVAQRVGGNVLHTVQVLRSADGQVRRVESATSAADGSVTARALTVSRVGDGEGFVQIADAADPSEMAVGLPSLVAGLDRARSLTPSRIVWDGRVDDPEPWPAQDGFIPAAADDIAGAIRRVLPSAASAGWLAVRIPFLERRSLPPEVRLIDAAIATAAARDGLEGVDVLEQVNWGPEFDRWVTTLPIVDHLDADTLRACRAISTATRGDAPEADTARAEAALPQLADALAERLADVRPIALIFGSDHSDTASVTDTLDRARRTAGADAAAELLGLLGA